MRINVHIEHLVLDGLPLRTSQGSLVQASLERELAQLLTGSGVDSELLAGGIVSRLPAASIQFTKDVPPARLGQQIASAVHETIGSSKALSQKSEIIPGPGQYRER